MQFLACAVIAVVLGVCTAGSIAHGATPPARSTGIVCWSDKSGRQLGCGYTVPPEYANNPTRELNSRGVTVKRTDAALSAEALRVRQEEAARRKIEDQERAEQRKRDLALTNSYTSEREIDARRDRDIQQLDLTILGLETHLKQMQSDENTLRRRVEAITKNGKPAPASLLEDLERATNEVTGTTRLISQKRNEQEGVRAKYNELRIRYLELTKREAAVR